MTIKYKLIRALAKFFALNYWAIDFLRLVISIYDNDQQEDIATNGELDLIKFLSKNLNKESIIFDIGSNKGDWSFHLMSSRYSGYLYAIDPLKKNIKASKERLKSFQKDRIFYSQYALSDFVGTSDFYINLNEADSGHDSLYDMSTIGYEENTTSTSVNVITLDKLVEQLNLDVIDMAKIDVEGNEFKVLLGAKNLLRNKKIKMFQVELGHAMRATKVYFHDIYELFENYNYKAYLIMPNGLRRLPFTPFLENRYSFVNLLFVHDEYVNDLKEIIN